MISPFSFLSMRCDVFQLGSFGNVAVGQSKPINTNLVVY